MPMSHSTPKPCGWQRDPTRNRRQLMGCVGGKLSCQRYPWSLVQKCSRASSIRTSCSNTDADPRRTAPTAIAAAIHRNLIAHVRHRFAPFRCRSQTQPRSEAVAGRSYRIESVRRAIGLPPSAPTSNPTTYPTPQPTTGPSRSPSKTPRSTVLQITQWTDRPTDPLTN